MTNNNDLVQFKNEFEKLQAIAYKDIVINNLNIRILGIHYMDCDDTWNIKRHKHSFFEFHYVFKDYVYTCINTYEQKITEGHFYLMPPGTYHSHRQDKGSGHIGFALRWEFIDNDTFKAQQENICYDLFNIKRILINAHTMPIEDDEKIYKRMICLLDQTNQNMSTLNLQLEFIQLISSISSFYLNNQSENIAKINYTYLENQIIRNAINFIEENYTQDINVNEISHCVHLSYSHLARVFKKYTGETINNYLNKIRLLQAQKLLVSTNKNISQIANEVGYCNDKYFCTIFKSYFGKSPGAFRNTRDILNE